MHLFHIRQCSISNRNAHISVLNEALWDMEQVHSGIWELGQFKLHSFISSLYIQTWNDVPYSARTMDIDHRPDSQIMMTSSNGNIFRVTGHLRGEFTGPRWIPHKGQWRGALMFSLICSQIDGWRKQCWSWWFEMPSRPLWDHCNVWM